MGKWKKEERQGEEEGERKGKRQAGWLDPSVQELTWGHEQTGGQSRLPQQHSCGPASMRRSRGRRACCAVGERRIGTCSPPVRGFPRSRSSGGMAPPGEAGTPCCHGPRGPALQAAPVTGTQWAPGSAPCQLSPSSVDRHWLLSSTWTARLRPRNRPTRAQAIASPAAELQP